MNYDHAYHAGNFADVFKHLALLAVVQSLLVKEKPFIYLDTHAGAGRYDLTSLSAQKTLEHEMGIKKLLSNQEEKPELVKCFLNVIANINSTKKIKYYPGSPLFVKSLLRPIDRMILTEVNPVVHAFLRDVFSSDKQVAIHHLDGYQGLKAFLPPNPRRGLVLIDPPYERKDEFDQILSSLEHALDRWKQGVYLIWYPIKNRNEINRFEKQLQKQCPVPKLITEFSLYPDDSPLKLNGSGLVILNPPWQLETQLNILLPWLLGVLDEKGRGHFRIQAT